MRIETERLTIRNLQESDVKSLVNIWTDPDVTYYMGGPRDYNMLYMNIMEDAGMKNPPKFDLWPVIKKSDGEVIGHCGFLDKEIDGNIEIELIYVLAKSAWGNGYATEAALGLKEYGFKELGLKRIVTLIDPENAGSERVAVKCGLKHEKDVLRPNGKNMRLLVCDNSGGTS